MKYESIGRKVALSHGIERTTKAKLDLVKRLALWEGEIVKRGLNPWKILQFSPFYGKNGGLDDEKDGLMYSAKEYLEKLVLGKVPSFS